MKHSIIGLERFGLRPNYGSAHTTRTIMLREKGRAEKSEPAYKLKDWVFDYE
jgi:hypothetical protein